MHCMNPAKAAAKVRLHEWLSFSVFCLFCLVFFFEKVQIQISSNF